jgi:hypothetical protein
LPIPIDVPYPTRVGAERFFAGANFVGKLQWAPWSPMPQH